MTVGHRMEGIVPPLHRHSYAYAHTTDFSTAKEWNRRSRMALASPLPISRFDLGNCGRRFL